MARARAGHDDRVVKPTGGGVREQAVHHHGHGGGQYASGHCLGKPLELAPHEQLDGHGHWQDEQGEQRQRTHHGDQGMRQPVARPCDVGLHAGRRGTGRHTGRRQRHDSAAGHEAAQQVEGPADAPLGLILDLDPGCLRCRHRTIVSPGHPAA